MEMTEGMSILKAIILGVVQGITEFLPVSSSGHLAILENMFGMTEAENVMLVNMFLHLGTLIAVCFFCWEEIVKLFRRPALTPQQMASGQRPYTLGQRQRTLVITAAVPYLLLIPVSRYIDILSTKTLYVGFAMVLTGFVLLCANKMEPGVKNERNSKGGDALLIGICQLVSALPGLSRAGLTLTAGLATGHKKEYCLKFFGLLSVPTLIITTILELVKAISDGVSGSIIAPCLVGMVAAMLSTVLGIDLLQRLMMNNNKQRNGFGGFAYYCWVIGVLVIILTFIF